MLIINRRRFFVSPTVKDIKETLSRFPDDYTFSICGDNRFYLHVDENPLDNSGAISFDHSSLDDVYEDDSVWLPIWLVEFTTTDGTSLSDNSVLNLAIVAAETSIDACDLVVTKFHISYNEIIRVRDHDRAINSCVPKIIANVELAR